MPVAEQEEAGAAVAAEELVDVPLRVAGAAPLAGVAEGHPRAVLAAAGAAVGVEGVGGARPELRVRHGADAGQFVNPVSVAIDTSGRLHVADQGNHRIQVFSGDGIVQQVFGARGNGAGQFDGPTGITIDASGRLYVADSGNRRVQVLTATGEMVAAITGGPETPLERPVDVAVSANLLYVSDAGRHSVQRFRIRP